MLQSDFAVPSIQRCNSYSPAPISGRGHIHAFLGLIKWSRSNAGVFQAYASSDLACFSSLSEAPDFCHVNKPRLAQHSPRHIREHRQEEQSAPANPPADQLHERAQPRSAKPGQGRKKCSVDICEYFDIISVFILSKLRSHKYNETERCHSQ